MGGLGKDLQRAILGNLPLIGVLYLSEGEKRARGYPAPSKELMRGVVEAALRSGVTQFAASPSGFNELAPIHLEVLREVSGEEEISLIPCLSVPLRLGGRGLNDYRRWATHLDYESGRFGPQVEERYLSDPILNFRPAWREGLKAAKAYGLRELEAGLKVDWGSWEALVSEFSDFDVAWVEAGTEVDLLAISRIDLLGELMDEVRGAGYRVLLGTHHAGATIPIVEEEGVGGLDGYVTPINKLGVMMFPTRARAEAAVEEAKRRGRLIVCVKPFAGGRIDPREALAYAYKRADACMVGAATPEEAEENFKLAEELAGWPKPFWA